MDGRTVKEDTVGWGADSVVEWGSCTFETSDEGPSAISSCTRDKGVKGRSYEARGDGGGREEVDSLEFDQARRGVPNDGRVGDSENGNPMAGGLEGKVRTLR